MTPARAAGFTLIEIMVAVALIAILAGVAVPMVAQGIERYALTSTSQQVTSTIRSARFQAVAKNTVLRVRFNYPAAGQYQVVDAASNPVGDVQYLTRGVSFGAGGTDLQISAAGRMTAASTIVITNGNASQDRTITVTTSGQVRLQ